MINISHIFCKLYDEYLFAHKQSHKITRRKYSTQVIFESLIKFVSNSCYFCRFSDTGLISGKYLNQIHHFLLKYSFYDLLYKHLLDIYLELTNCSTLKRLSIDSTFIRNVLGSESKARNPKYYNKTGFKVQILVDTCRTVIGLHITDCVDSDYTALKPLLGNTFIEESKLMDNNNTILCDAGYEGLTNNYMLTEGGYNICMSYNSRNRKIESSKILPATEKERELYKERVVVENKIGNIQRTPILLNNYERSKDSYRGILLFDLCRSIAKKINKIIKLKNSREENKCEEIKDKKRKKRIKKKELEMKKKRDKEEREERDRRKKKQKEEQKEEQKKLREKIINEIFKNADNIEIILSEAYKRYMIPKILKKIKRKIRGKQK